jgi:transketolase
MNANQTWRELATQLRVDSIRCTTQAGSGHPTSCMSAADLMAVLLASHLRYDIKQPRAFGNDRIIFSKGHAAPLLYCMLKAMGAISDDELMTLRKLGSPIEGHPTPALPFVEVATGSLGQGLAMAVGMALAAKRLKHLENRFWVLLGDSEMAEGSVYESLEAASFYDLSNIVALVDMNRLGQRGPTMLVWDADAYASRAEAFGWETRIIDGHDLAAIDAAYGDAERSSQPTLIVARTKKGAGVSFVEDQENWHGKSMSHDEAKRAFEELGWNQGAPSLVITPPQPVASQSTTQDTPNESEQPSYQVGDTVATRSAFGDALAALGSNDPRIVVLDSEVANSTYTERFGKAHSDRFFEMYIAEQQMVSAALGMFTFGFTPFASTFAAFFTRAYDQIRMAAISRATLNLVGSHAGVSIGEDGPSQMGLEDLAMLRAVHGSVVLYPSCANATVSLTAEMAKRTGINYLRTTREKTPVLYPAGEVFTIGGSKVLRRSDKDVVAIVAAGITVHEALKAHDLLQQQAIAARVIDLYSVKPVDRDTLREAATACARGLIVVEDHHPEGGLADAVTEAFDGRAAPRIRRLAVRTMPGSASPMQQLQAAGIDAGAIAEAVKQAVAD